jgi:hypothetical protein
MHFGMSCLTASAAWQIDFSRLEVPRMIPHRASSFVSRVSTLTILIVVAILTGCANYHLYRQDTHELAVQALTSFEEAALAEALVDERQLMSEVLALELEVVRRHTIVRRNAWLRAVIGDTTSSWSVLGETAVASRLESLVGDSRDPIVGDIIEHLQTMPKRLNDLKVARDRYLGERGPRDPSATCPVQDTRTAEEPLASSFFDNYKEDCAEYLAEVATLRERFPANSELGKVQLLLDNTAAAIKELQDSSKAATKQLTDAKKQHAEAIRDRDSTVLQRTSAELKEALGTLAKPLEIGTKLDDAFVDLGLGGQLALVETQLASIEAILDAVSDTTQNLGASPNESTKLHLRMVSFLSTLEGRISDLHTPQPSVLLFESERLRLERERIKRRIANAEARLGLLDVKRDALLGEVFWLGKNLGTIKLHRQREDTGNCEAKKSIVDTFQQRNSSCRELVANALLYYANSWTLGRVVQEEVDYRLIAARHDAALDASEIALAQWQNLIGVPLSQLAAFHGAGIRSDQVRNFIQALGFSGLIAVGAID